MSRMVFLDHPELSGRVSLQRNYKRATLSSAKNTLEIVETIGTAKTGMQEGLNRVLPQEEGEPLLVFLMSQCYCISGVVSQNKKLVHKVFPQKAVFEMRISCFKLVGFDKIWRDSLYPDHFIINELRRFFRTKKSAFFTLKQYNQNHRLSRWYAPRLQGDIAGSPTRALKKFANCNFFTGRR